MSQMGQNRPIQRGRAMSAVTQIVLQNAAAFCNWAGFEHWSAFGVVR